MIIRLFGHTIEVHVSKDNYSRRYAGKLLTQANSYTSSQVGYKIALIKALRIEKDMSLVDAKEAIESMFDFDSRGNPVIR